MRYIMLLTCLLLSDITFAGDWQLVIQPPAIVVEHRYQQPAYARQPAIVVVHAPLVHQQHWPRYCQQYGACYLRVQFVTVKPLAEQRHWRQKQHKQQRRYQHRHH